MYGWICPDCGCHLDPGEKCDCREERAREGKGNEYFSVTESGREWSDEDQI